mgnify:CR=1 FL=1
MAVIQRLSQHVADLIAAGEVVERPASCVKELVENAIDAGAKTVTVELQNGGMTLLRVTDDGCGMEADDARTAFLRHATSKLHTKEDLTAIRTLGFRGEALAAISAVSRIDLLTRTAQAQTGTALHLEAGVVTDEQPAGCPVGTTILVRDLFYNTPARLKFMKSDLAESSAALTVAQHLALANPGVSLRVVKDGAEALHTAGSGVLFDAVYAVLGRQLAGEMVKVDGKFEKIETSGFATRPACTRGNRQQQLFFVNGRFVKSRLLMSALEQAYQNQMTVGRFPSCVLHIQLPPQAVDVNVHPAKTEVKFLREREVFDAVHYAVLSALGRASGRQELKLPQQKPAQAPAAQAKPQQDFFKTMDAAQYRAQAEKTAKPAFTAREREWTKTVCEAARIPAADVPKAPRAEQTHTVAEPVKHPEQEAPRIAEVPPVEPVQQTLPIADAPWRVIGEALDTYILVQQGEKLLFIDKHAAHERILFEKLKKEPQPVMAQRLLAPIPAELGREEAACVLENAALFTRLGFGAEEFGDGTLLLREIPESIRAEDAAQTVQELAGALLGGNFPDAGAQRDALLHTVACKAAIKANMAISPLEQRELIKKVLALPGINTCPHGRPIMIKMTKEKIEKEFKRI